jgi:hypothetical protein
MAATYADMLTTFLENTAAAGRSGARAELKATPQGVEVQSMEVLGDPTAGKRAGGAASARQTVQSLFQLLSSGSSSATRFYSATFEFRDGAWKQKEFKLLRSEAPPAPPTPLPNVDPVCDPPTENYPYREETFRVIKSLAELIKTYSKVAAVPAIAVAGSIADEYNTQRGVKGGIDWFQDSVLIKYMPNFAIELDAWIGADSKLLNATKHDIGKGNIKLETAKHIYDRYRASFEDKDMDYGDLVDYLLSDQGTVHVAALVIKEASEELGSYVKDYSAEMKEAIYVTFYKQGPSYRRRFVEALAKDSGRRLKPGEGCRVFLQRARFKEVLGI